MYVCMYVYVYVYMFLDIYYYIYGFPISCWDDLNQLIPCFNHGTYVTTTVRDSRKSDHVLTMPTLHGEEVPLLCWGERSECFSCSSGFKLPSQWLCTYIYIYIYIYSYTYTLYMWYMYVWYVLLCVHHSKTCQGDVKWLPCCAVKGALEISAGAFCQIKKGRGDNEVWVWAKIGYPIIRY